MNEVVAADSEPVAVARNLPHCHLRIRNLIACRYCRSTSVDGMETVGIHVVRQTRAASYAGDDGSLVGERRLSPPSLSEEC